MAILKKHIPQVHDIHLYNDAWSYSPRIEPFPQSFNQNCQAAHIDWSGVSLRQRAYYRTIPSTFTAGFTEPYVASDINFWNTGNPCAVLISPKHALICQHYRGTHERTEEWYYFLGKNGAVHSRKVSKATLNIGADHTLLEFESSFPDDVKYYSQIADVRYIKQGSSFWIHDCNGKAYKCIFGQAQLDSKGSVSAFLYSPSSDPVNIGIQSNGWPCIFGGDSGSPCFVTDSIGNTVLIGLMHGGMQINETEILNINNAISNTGQSVTHVRPAAKAADINQDGVVDASDMAEILAAWGNGDVFKDLNKDGSVDAQDMSIIMSQWGKYELLPNVMNPTVQLNSSSASSGTKPRV